MSRNFISVLGLIAFLASVSFLTSASVLAAVPECISNPTNIPKGQEEATVASLTAHLSDDEMITRLVFAESLASECFHSPAPVDGTVEGVTEGIAWTILNRVRDLKKTGREIVTARKQYRSTMGTCDVAKRSEFLCPIRSGSTEALTRQVWNAAERSVARARAGKGNPIRGVHNYFFPKAFDHSKNCASFRGKFPDWASPGNEVPLPKPVSSALGGCLRFYRTRPVSTPHGKSTVYDRAGLKDLPREKTEGLGMPENSVEQAF